MGKKRRFSLLMAAIATLVVVARGFSVVAENIDPSGGDSQYAWAENVGWLNAEPNGDGGPGVQVGDSELSGWMWGENAGWLSLSCKNTLSCATINYGVLNDGNGVLSGYAWAENAGWLSLTCENTASCGTADYGVEIDTATGDFSGYAWGENIGWVSFNCSNTGSCGTVDYKVKTGWICDPPPPPPLDVPTLTVTKSDGDVVLLWTTVVGATQYDIVVGDLGVLRATGGDFALATMECLDDNCTTSKQRFEPGSEPFEGAVVMVRGTNCGGNGSYDSGGISQMGLRDAEIAASGNDCQ